MIKCCIFDLDGTLIDSLEDLANATNFALNKFGFPTHTLESYKQFVGNGVDKLIERVLPEEQRTDEIKKQMRTTFDKRYYEHCFDCTKPYIGIVDMLQELKSRNKILAVVTNKTDDIAKKIIYKLFANTFDDIYGNIVGIPTKPAPDLALRVAANRNLEPYNCAFIGDSNVDIQTAINAKMISIGVTWGFRSKSELQQAGAKYIIDEPFEITELVK